MKKLLWLRPSHGVDVHMDTEPGVWLTGFQVLDTEGQCEVRNYAPDIHFAAVYNFPSAF